MNSNKKIHTPVPPQRKFPQEEPNSENNRGINQKSDPEEKKDKDHQPKKIIPDK